MSHRPDTISPEVLSELMAADRVTVLDARPRKLYERSAERIPRAIHVDAGSGAALDELLLSLPNEKLIVAYCDEPGEALSARVARRARELGRGDASHLEGGLAAWKADHETELNPDQTRGENAYVQTHTHQLTPR